MDANDVDMRAIQGAQHLGADDLGGGAGGGAAAGEIDDAVHACQQRIHVVRRNQHRDFLRGGEVAEDRNYVGDGADVEVGQRFVEQEQAGAADEGVGDEHALGLAAGEGAEALLGIGGGADGGEHGVDLRRALAVGEREAEPVAVEAEGHEVAGAEREVGVEGEFLRDVADAAGGGDAAGGFFLEAEDGADEGGFAGAVGADEAADFAGAEGKGDVVEDGAVAEGDGKALDGEGGRHGDFGRGFGGGGQGEGRGRGRWVEVRFEEVGLGFEILVATHPVPAYAMAYATKEGDDG